ncbi:hypothetical protein OG196_44000 (plasmid) [Kitasatospora purpeofusca]|uniref:hypothetical protein n=1 Tax=Kitasatospora purpeofusca TaxID=67352 RepID=UPI002E1367BB|nr:hypothetical protein OG196_44000 [Kitasatospora purpeofusca]
MSDIPEMVCEVRGHPGPVFGLFAVEQAAAVLPIKHREHLVAVRALRVVLELEPHRAWGPNGAAVLAMLGRIPEFTMEQLHEMHATGSRLQAKATELAVYDETGEHCVEAPGHQAWAVDTLTELCDSVDGERPEYVGPAAYISRQYRDNVQLMASAAHWYRRGETGNRPRSVWNASGHGMGSFADALWRYMEWALCAEVCRPDLSAEAVDVLQQPWRAALEAPAVPACREGAAAPVHG